MGGRNDVDDQKINGPQPPKEAFGQQHQGQEESYEELEPFMTYEERMKYDDEVYYVGTGCQVGALASAFAWSGGVFGVMGENAALSTGGAYCLLVFGMVLVGYCFRQGGICKQKGVLTLRPC